MVTIEWFLRSIGIYPHRCGHDFIRDMVELTLHTKNTTMKPLYERVAKMHNVSVFSVQNGIRKACEGAYKSKKHLNINLILKAKVAEENRPLTNSEIVFFISNYLKRDCVESQKNFSEIYGQYEGQWI